MAASSLEGGRPKAVTHAENLQTGSSESSCSVVSLYQEWLDHLLIPKAKLLISNQSELGRGEGSKLYQRHSKQPLCGWAFGAYKYGNEHISKTVRSNLNISILIFPSFFVSNELWSLYFFNISLPSPQLFANSYIHTFLSHFSDKYL